MTLAKLWISVVATILNISPNVARVSLQKGKEVIQKTRRRTKSSLLPPFRRSGHLLPSQRIGGAEARRQGKPPLHVPGRQRKPRLGDRVSPLLPQNRPSQQKGIKKEGRQESHAHKQLAPAHRRRIASGPNPSKFKIQRHRRRRPLLPHQHQGQQKREKK